ncbi:hypothetical protein GCM10010344_20360 [Streptomyces bluensis]|nr:hypothetical protein GCM10010344_20360 [Streptomyces bluensis]
MWPYQGGAVNWSTDSDGNAMTDGCVLTGKAKAKRVHSPRCRPSTGRLTPRGWFLCAAQVSLPGV